MRAIKSLLVVMLTLPLVVPSLAGGHARSAYSKSLWHKDHFSIDYYFTNNFPGGKFKSSVKNGGKQWNKIYRGPRFVAHDSPRLPAREVSAGWCGPDLDGRDVMAINWQTLDGKSDPEKKTGRTLAVHQGCRWSSGPYAGYSSPGTISFDSAEQWYARTGDAPDDAMDMWSVATHEFGHALGAKHYAKSRSYCDDNAAQETMCPTYFTGTERQRTPHRHDTHTFVRVYPLR